MEATKCFIALAIVVASLSIIANCEQIAIANHDNVRNSVSSFKTLSFGKYTPIPYRTPELKILEFLQNRPKRFPLPLHPNLFANNRFINNFTRGGQQTDKIQLGHGLMNLHRTHDGNIFNRNRKLAGGGMNDFFREPGINVFQRPPYVGYASAKNFITKASNYRNGTTNGVQKDGKISNQRKPYKHFQTQGW